jgi:hypothetical protein
MTKQEIHQAFLNTSFNVLTNPAFTIKIDVLVPEAQQFNSWAFITAWNPLPVILSLEENRNRNQNLEEEIISFGLKYSHGKGVSEDEAWFEESFFIANISLDKANEYAAKYGQLAFVYGKKSEKAQLVYTVF